MDRQTDHQSAALRLGLAGNRIALQTGSHGRAGGVFDVCPVRHALARVIAVVQCSLKVARRF